MHDALVAETELSCDQVEIAESGMQTPEYHNSLNFFKFVSSRLGDGFILTQLMNDWHFRMILIGKRPLFKQQCI